MMRQVAKFFIVLLTLLAYAPFSFADNKKKLPQIPIAQETGSLFELTEKENGLNGKLKLLKSMLQLLDHRGKVLWEYKIEGKAPKFARILGSWKNGPVFLLSSDFSAGFGSYSGVVTQLGQVIAGKFEWAKVKDGNDKNQTTTISLMQSLKTHWKLTVNSEKKEIEILKVACRPDFEKIEKLGANLKDELPFVVWYDRYRFDGQAWQKFEIKRTGFWEYEGGETFPKKEMFP